MIYDFKILDLPKRISKLTSCSFIITILLVLVCGIICLSHPYWDVFLSNILTVENHTYIINPDNPSMPTIQSTHLALHNKDEWISYKDGMIMLYISAGDFIMGSSDGDSNEKPIHKVYLNSFWIDQTEVTNGMYERCVWEGICAQPRSSSSYTRDSYYGNPEFENYPVTYVSWHDAKDYCSWRENKSRLPTEAEWEKAARGYDGRTYPWGDTITCAFSNYDECVGDTTDVNNYRIGQSPFGVYDMAGNVWEWVADWYLETYYQISPMVNPLGPNSGQFRVLRGGSWLNYGSSVTTTLRNWRDPVTTSGNLGFRCARSEFP